MLSNNRQMRKVELPDDILLSNVRILIADGHTVTIRVKGNSMRPFLENGRDSVILAPFSELKRGDVILAEITQGQYILHRIIRMKGDCLTLMGDGNLKGTESCNTSDVIGVVTTLIRDGKPLDCSSRKWKISSRIWGALRPMRRYLLAIYRRII